MQPGRHLGSEEGILGSCSVVQKIMSVPCGAVSGDRSQMQPLLYGRLSFSAENSLPPSQTSTKTFSGYCGSLRLKWEEKARGKKRLSLSPPTPFLPLDHSGVLGGAMTGPSPSGGPRPPLSPRPTARTPPSTGNLLQVSGGQRGTGPRPGWSPESVPPPAVGSRSLEGVARSWVAKRFLRPGGNRGPGSTPRPAPPAAWGGKTREPDLPKAPCPAGLGPPGLVTERG